MTVGCYNLKQRIVPLAIAMQAVARLLEQVNTTCGTWYVVLDQARVSFQSPLLKKNKSH